jgi:hypothetical protein
VDQKKAGLAHQGQDPHQPHKADAVVGLLQQQVLDVHLHSAQGRHRQLQEHPKGLGQVPGASAEEEDRDGPAGVLFQLGQCATVVKYWFADHSIYLLQHCPCSPDLAPADVFLFQTVKEDLAGHSLD